MAATVVGHTRFTCANTIGSSTTQPLPGDLRTVLVADSCSCPGCWHQLNGVFVKAKLVAALVAALTVVAVLGAPAHASTSWLSGHVQNIGWADGTAWGPDNGAEVGTTGRSLRLEAVRLNEGAAHDAFTARGFVQTLGWVDQTPDSDRRTVVGTTGRSLWLEAVQLTPIRPGVTVHCQAHVQNIGWMAQVVNGATCGTTGQNLRLEAIRVWVTFDEQAT